MPIPNKTLKELARGKQDLAEKACPTARPREKKAGVRRRKIGFSEGKSAAYMVRRAVLPPGKFSAKIPLKNPRFPALPDAAHVVLQRHPAAAARSISRPNFFPVSNLSAFLQVAARNGP